MRPQVYSRFPELRPDTTRIALGIEVYPTKWYWLGQATIYATIAALVGAALFL